jgi:L-alanine-DL-glutamate epimerase-like enolase superfamily enzyme
VKEIEPYLVGKDPRRVAHHWQAIYRHAFYRGGPILTGALSGIDQALWDIKGKALDVPIYELLGGPTRDKVRVYAHSNSPESMKRDMARPHGLQDRSGQAPSCALHRNPRRSTVRRRTIRRAAQDGRQ